MADKQIIANLRALAVHANAPFPEHLAAMAEGEESLIAWYDGWNLTDTGYWAIVAHQADQIDQVIATIRQFGEIEGEGHKQWLINTVLKLLMGKEGYKAFIREYERGGRAHWDRGIAP